MRENKRKKFKMRIKRMIKNDSECSGLKHDNVGYIHLTLLTIKDQLNIASMHM